ncbi:MAG TPA: potassium-transporting ATPase subunit KdpC [Prolixibacteraceae bacterium]|jgi:K+-transporting ATPase ATPase C chain|nr:potassium-transporting ATPase subunit KdpC [Prolixibacteraceae bacterium]
MKTQIEIALKIFALFTIVLGVVYPLFITGIAQLAFPFQANGSLIRQGDKVIGSELIGQKFDSVTYFSSRPSAIEYNPMPSGGSNLGPTSSKLKQLVADRKAQWIKSNLLSDSDAIPSEMIFASASGLDPHISPKAALMQVERIVKARQFDSDKKEQLLKSIAKLTEGPQFTFLGEERINVLRLNLQLDQLANH